MKHILAMLLALLGASGALAQIYVKVVPEKKTFLSGEAMYMRLTITNNSGVPVELKSREYSSWLDIHVEHSTAGAELPQSKFALFPPLKVPAGMSVSRKIDLRHFYDLSREGNYHVQAVVKMPNQKDMFASQKSLFAVRTGTPMWSQTVAIPASAKRCTFSICTIAVRGIQKLYVQTKDPDTGVAYNAVCIGDWLGTTRPQCMVDGKANVHVFFPTTPMNNTCPGETAQSRTVAKLKHRLRSGQFTNAMPGERELSKALAAGRGTIRKALAQLQEEGFLAAPSLSVIPFTWRFWSVLSC